MIFNGAPEGVRIRVFIANATSLAEGGELPHIAAPVNIGLPNEPAGRLTGFRFRVDSGVRFGHMNQLELDVLTAHLHTLGRRLADLKVLGASQIALLALILRRHW